MDNKHYIESIILISFGNCIIVRHPNDTYITVLGNTDSLRTDAYSDYYKVLKGNTNKWAYYTVEEALTGDIFNPDMMALLRQWVRNNLNNTKLKGT